ncbi:MAG: YihA family ribosome biogenesis GTP-binding protein [Betaproteobacteria bacterium]|nr:YihA family ribosome biogenesis GTP-binding protein [Betaproteobacteria bacterium]
MPPSPAFSQVEFLISVADLDGLPSDDLPEVAFIGRSNVGKSSALNALANRKRLAFVSKTPGRTQLINFFTLGPHARLVDLPGYGYAKVPLTVRDAWGRLVGGYLEVRPQLIGVVSIMDARHPFMPLDRQLLGWLAQSPLHVQTQRKLLVLLSKADKLTKSEQGRTLQAVQRELKTLGLPGEARLFSSQTHQGVDETREQIEAWLAEK